MNSINKSSRRQINNLKLRTLPSGKTGVFSPSGKVLEEFKKSSDAITWASNTTDFLKRPKRA